jgi:hypothetical protein
MKGVRLWMALAAVWLALIEPVHAADTYVVLGVGTDSCGSWTTERQTVATAPSSKAFSQSQWLLGYLTAINADVWPDHRLTDVTDSDGIFAWVDNYCAAHPLDDIATASSALVLELMTRAGAKKK